MTQSIQPHNLKAAATWGAPGGRYDTISRGIADAIEHCIARLDIQPGERVLDLACGSGWASRSIADSVPDVQVVGVDLASDLVDAARAHAKRLGLSIDYRIGDAESLDLETGSFDVVISTFGIMFASRPEQAARELARIVKRGGRIGLTTWKPDSTVFEMFTVMKAYLPAPAAPPPPSPFAWGSMDRVRELLGDSFELGFEAGTSPFRAGSPELAWEIWTTCYGPTKTLAATLSPERRDAFRRDMIAFHERFQTELGVAKPRDYLVTVGRRTTR